MLRSAIAIAALVLLACSSGCDESAQRKAQYEKTPAKPKVPPTMTFLVCDGNNDSGLHAEQVLLKLAKRKDGSFADFGSDPVHDSQAFEILKSESIERRPDPLPDTLAKFETAMISLKVWEGHLKPRSGSVKEMTSDLLYLPTVTGDWILNRQTLELSYFWETEYFTKKGTAPCSVTDKKLWLARLEEYRVELEKYRARVEAANPGDTRKI